MKKVLVIVSAVFMLAAITTSCGNKTGCHCYVKTDIAHLAPVYEDETSTKDECKAMEKQLNDEEGMGMNVYKCNQ